MSLIRTTILPELRRHRLRPLAMPGSPVSLQERSLRHREDAPIGDLDSSIGPDTGRGARRNRPGREAGPLQSGARFRANRSFKRMDSADYLVVRNVRCKWADGLHLLAGQGGLHDGCPSVICFLCRLTLINFRGN
jgi:hypothetical protein